MKSTKPFIILGIIFLLVPVMIFIYYGDIYQSYSLCQTSTTQECINLRTIVVLIPASIIIGLIFFIFASIKRVKK